MGARRAGVCAGVRVCRRAGGHACATVGDLMQRKRSGLCRSLHLNRLGYESFISLGKTAKSSSDRVGYAMEYVGLTNTDGEDSFSLVRVRE